MKKYWFIAILMILQVSCHSNPHYAKNPLALDNFNFGLNINTFFDDEKYFRGTDAKLTSNKGFFSDTSFIYYQYSTFIFERKVPLAKYKKVQFEDLGVLSDSTDQHPLLVVGSSSYATPDDVKIIIDDLLKIDDKPKIRSAFMNGTSIIFKAPDRIITVYLKISFDDYSTTYILIDEDYRSEKVTENILTKSKYEELFTKLDERNKNDISVFVIDPTFDRIYNKYNDGGSSGFMTRYRTR